MYSFEGKYRSTPQVSLGGRSQQDKFNKENLLEKAHNERQKREEIRRRLHSALILQSWVRSYLVRKRLKKELRSQFEVERKRYSDVRKNVDQLVTVTRWLRFFYASKSDEDNEKLTWLGQKLLQGKTSWILSDSNDLFLTCELLKICCRSLSASNESSTITIPLRILETFTSPDFIQQEKCLTTENMQRCLLRLWSRLVNNGYFSSILHILSSRVPSDIQPVSSGTSAVPPPTPLAGTLFSLLLRPLSIAGTRTINSNTDVHIIMESFVTQILCEPPTYQLYHYIYPAFAASSEFPTSLLLTTLESALSEMEIVPKSPSLLATIMKLVHLKSDDLSMSSFTSYICCLQWLISKLPRIRQDDDDLSDSDDDDDYESANAMDYSVYTSEGSLVSLETQVQDCHSQLMSDCFIDSFIRRRIHEFEDYKNLNAICAICYHLIAVSRATVHKNKLLYTLASSSSFLRKLWGSTVGTTTSSKITGRRVPVVQLLFEGSPMTREETSSIQFKLVVFCSLFTHNLLSIHDTDFYSATTHINKYMAFTTSELVIVALTIRNVCIAVIKQAIPETRTRTRTYDVRTILRSLSSGQSVKLDKQPGGSKEAEAEWDINETVFLFKVCRQLVKHLHTRDVRRPFVQKNSWLSNSILVKTENSNDFAHRWHQRSENNAVAAHLANTTDEDIVLSVTEARQLAVLINIPFVIAFETRVSIFVTMLKKDRESRESARYRMMEDAGFSHSSVTNEVTVRREFLYEDAFDELSLENAPDLRRSLRVSFINTAGMNEAGYGAGVTREFLQQVVKTGFDPMRGLFKTTAQGRLYPNPNASSIIQDCNKHFFFLGRLLGKVIYEGMQVELPFAAFFLCKVLQQRNVDINHLQSLDPDFYKNLMYLHEYDSDISELDLNFTVVDETFGVTEVTELIPNGKNTSVVNSNKVLYMHLMAHYKLNIQMRAPCQYFREGLESIITVDWLRMFDHQELQTLISGAEIPIDIEDLRLNSAYSGGYSSEHPTIISFWEVLNELTNEELSQFLLFVTSCSRPPLLGFKELQPPFCIQRGGSEERLPTASTCLNLLKLPEYSDAKILRSKLLYCLQSSSGFELS